LKKYNVGNGNLRESYWDSAISVLSGGTATTLTGVSLAAAVPPIDNTPVLLSVSFTPATAADKVGITPFGSVATSIQAVSGVVAAKAQVAQIKALAKLDTATPKVLYINSAASGATTLLVVGYELFL